MDKKRYKLLRSRLRAMMNAADAAYDSYWMAGDYERQQKVNEQIDTLIKEHPYLLGRVVCEQSVGGQVLRALENFRNYGHRSTSQNVIARNLRCAR